MSRILLVDDDDAFRPALQKNLESLGHDVVTSANGRLAQETLAAERFDLVISDIRMPVVDGLELTRHIKATSRLPVILITGFSEILETHEAHQLGADEFLPKPFERQDLVQAIERCLAPEGAEPLMDERSFCKVALEDFTSGRQILFNIFVRLSERKYVKIAAKGEDLALERIHAYKQKGVRYLHLRKDDFSVYVGFNLSLGQAIRANRMIPTAKKMNLLRHTGELLLMQVVRDGIDPDFFDGSAAFVDNAVDILTDEPDVLALLEALRNHSDFLYAHCVATSLYGVMIANAVGWTLPTNRFKVAVGGLLHDVGQKELDSSLLTKPRGAWTIEEVKLYESHPLRSVEILREIKAIPSDVLQVVKEHHEDGLAQGFPSGLRKGQTHPMARLVAVANEFCDRVIKGPHAAASTPAEAIRQMSLLRSERLDPLFLNALKQIFSRALEAK